MLQSMGWQRVGHDWATELNWLKKLFPTLLFYFHRFYECNLHDVSQKLSSKMDANFSIWKSIFKHSLFLLFKIYFSSSIKTFSNHVCFTLFQKKPATFVTFGEGDLVAGMRRLSFSLYFVYTVSNFLPMHTFPIQKRIFFN